MRSKLGRLFATLVVVVGLFVLFGRDWLAERAFQRALDTSVGVDQSAKLPDGLHAYVCGSGSPMPDATRAGPCIAVLAGNQAFVFDAGSGAIRKLLRMGFPVDKLQAGFLTHLHSDHIDGLGELMLQAWVGGSRTAPLPVYGPEGTGQVLAGLMSAYEIDKGYRIAHHGPTIVRPSGFGGAAQVLALPDGTDSMTAYDRGGVKITVIRVDHKPIAPAFAYRIDYKGRSLAISGDTVFSPAFNSASKGVDVMFHEALNMEMVAALGAKLGERGRKDSAQIMTDIQNYHASPADAARAAQAAGAKSLVLYHLVPPVPVRLIERKFLGDAPDAFDGDMRLANDGMMVSLPAGGKSIDFSNAF